MTHVLIVDDSPTETHVLKDILVKRGFEVSAATNGEDGIEKAKETLPDVVLMDVVMPGLNGFQATRQLRKDPKTEHIPVIIVTTKDQATDKMWGMRQGASDYLTKPVDPQNLVNTINSVLNT
ncbi:MAG: response regulator [Pseudomonadota bacterium]